MSATVSSGGGADLVISVELSGGERARVPAETMINRELSEKASDERDGLPAHQYQDLPTLRNHTFTLPGRSI